MKYYKVAGTDTVVPIMSLGDQLSRMSLHRIDADPVVDALKRGKLPTLGDVKRSLKVFITFHFSLELKFIIPTDTVND